MIGFDVSMYDCSHPQSQNGEHACHPCRHALMVSNPLCLSSSLLVKLIFSLYCGLEIYHAPGASDKNESQGLPCFLNI